MLDGDENLTRKIAPEWVTFLDVPMWIEKQFGITPPTEWELDLVSVIRENNKLVRYRIKGLNALALKFHLNRSGLAPIDAFWFEPAPHDNRQLAVVSWNEPHFDATTFTIAGPTQKDGGHGRHEIEVRWDDIRRWLKPRVTAYRQVRQRDSNKNAEPQTEPAQQAIQRSTAIRSGRGGRRPRTIWDRFWIEVAHFTGLNGLEDLDRPRLQKEMETWAAVNSDDPATPIHPKTIADKLRGLYTRAKESN